MLEHPRAGTDGARGAARLGVLYAADAYANAQRKMGRQQAGVGLLGALIDACPGPSFTIAAPRQEDLSGLKQELRGRRPQLPLHLWPLDKLDRLTGVEALFVADPNLARWAELRQWHAAGSGAWSLIGLTHTLSSLGALEALRRFPAAPLQPWDALICTSRCARAAVQEVLDHEAEALARRFGGDVSRWAAPQLPVIPLGCDVESFAGLAQQRPAARAALQLPPEQPVLLFVGRLEFHVKAHPGVLLQALARVAQSRATAQPSSPPPCVLVLGTAQNNATLRAWQQAQAHFKPWFELRLLDGANPQLSNQAWAAADVFVSLADSLQETFGLTPVEAMACGLPVIASDWNGYRDTVVHGATGLLIPTSQPGPDAGHTLADLSLGRLSYDAAMATAMRQVVVAEEPLVAALGQLLGDAALRQRLGEAGRRRVQEHYSWPHVIGQIQALAGELNQRRAAAGSLAASQSARQPARPGPTPWRQFASWPTRTHRWQGELRLEPQRVLQRLHDMETLRIYSSLSTAAEPSLQLPALVPLAQLLRQLCLGQHEPLCLDLVVLAAQLPGQTTTDLQQALAWLAKIGALELPA